MTGSTDSAITFSVVVPTAGRPSLSQALASVASQLRPGDEMIVVCSDDNDFGNAARNSAVERARGSHLIFLDDDDEYLPGSFARMRDFVYENLDRVGVFQQRLELVGDYFSTSAIGAVVPNVPGKVGRFRPADPANLRPLRPGETAEFLSVRWGDYEFLRSTLALRGDEEIRVPIATYAVRPEKRPWRRLRYRIRLRSRIREWIAIGRKSAGYASRVPTKRLSILLRALRNIAAQRKRSPRP